MANLKYQEPQKLQGKIENRDFSRAAITLMGLMCLIDPPGIRTPSSSTEEK
jgi:hypothetical protein